MAKNEIEELFENGPKRERKPTKYACTVVSLLPFELLEEKPHMLPSAFKVPAAKGYDKPGILHVEEGIHYIPNPLIDEGKPGSSIRQTTSPNEMARSIVEDYASAHVALSDNGGPGLFWVEGRLTAKQIVEEYADLLGEYKQRQKNWFRNLCALADADWQKNHNMLAVSDLQRAAARDLGIKKDWVEFVAQETMNCPFCTVAIPPAAVKCPNCSEIVDKKRYDEMKGAA